MLERIDTNMETLALELVTLEDGDISTMGKLMNCLGSLKEDSSDLGESSFTNLVQALEGYLEKMILNGESDVVPMEEGVKCLQTICRSLVNRETIIEDISPLLDKLDYKEQSDDPGELERGDREDVVGHEKEMDETSQIQKPGEEDRELLEEFTNESLENLCTIEVSLLELEQNPDDLNTLNDIFRPFHTIKGVSGMLKLNKIGKLAHGTENLLEKARSSEIRVEGPVVDIILESVDVLKEMLNGVTAGLDIGGSLESSVDIVPLLSRIDAIITQADNINCKPIGEILVQKGAIATEDLEQAIERQKEEPEKKIGELLIGDKKTDSKEVLSALRDQKQFGKRIPDRQIKVDTEKMDSLIDMTGELVIAQAMLRQNPHLLLSKDQQLYHDLGRLNQITAGLQRTAMSMRMVPIKNTFKRMVRLVRDLSKKAGKEIELEMIGEDTEIDRNLVEELYEPLVHMIRNTVDHGIEKPEIREAAGKTRKGTIILMAYHKGGSIIIEIRDDGGGLDKKRIVEKAGANNLIDDESKLSESEIHNLIFTPGFSTAEKITDISGRGVGMDVVKKGIEKLKGKVEIESIPGRGTSFIIRLPLTLAVIEGMLVRIGEEKYIIPTHSILEAFQPDKSQITCVKGKGEMVLLHDNLFPVISLSRYFGVKEDSIHSWEGLLIAVENDGEKMCLQFDEILGKEEVVIKSLGEGMKSVKGIAGGTIMGDGRVALILDMAGVFQMAKDDSHY